MVLASGRSVSLPVLFANSQIAYPKLPVWVTQTSSPSSIPHFFFPGRFCVKGCLQLVENHVHTYCECWRLTSTYFLALSHAPPVLDIETAIWTPETRAPAKRPARVLVPKRMPTTTGESITRQPGGIISDREACNQKILISMKQRIPGLQLHV